MPYLQPETNQVFGLQPASGPNGRTNLYAVSSSEATAILPGDACVFTSGLGTVKAATGASTGQWAGVAAQALSTASYAAATRNLLLYDDPEQQFAIAVTTSAGMGLDQLYKSFLLVTTATGTGIPSSLVSRSKMALGVAGSSGGLVTMIGLHPVEALASGGFVVTTSVGKPQKYIVAPDAMAAAQGPIST